ncbi:MAG: hypothetical protein ACK52J_01740 [bacterium]|jgi:tRNA A-37 threonylcarbamoyl transferase component Bud32
MNDLSSYALEKILLDVKVFHNKLMIALKIIKAIENMHSNNIFHGHLTPSNIFI